MVRKVILVVVVALVASACDGSSSPSSVTQDADAEATTSAPGVSTTGEDRMTTTSTSKSASDLDELDLGQEAVEFIAAIEELLVDTTYADPLAEDPEVFIATGLLFCDQLTRGLGPVEILSTYVEALGNGPVDDANDDTLTLAGSILGVAVGYLCPEHTDSLEGEN